MACLGRYCYAAVCQVALLVSVPVSVITCTQLNMCEQPPRWDVQKVKAR